MFRWHSGPVWWGVLAFWLGVQGLAGAEADEVIVRGRGIEVRRTELEAGLGRLKAQALRRGQMLDEAQLDGLRQSLLDQMILLRLCASRAEEADRAVARIESRKFIAGLKQSQGVEGFDRLLKQAGYTEAEFEAEKLAEALANAVIDREVKVGIRIPTQDVKEYYEAHSDRWIEPGAVRVLYLSLPSDPPKGEAGGTGQPQRTRMEGWKAQLDAGKDFSTLLQSLGAGGASGSRGGERRIVRGEIGGAVEDLIFAQDPGKFGPVVEQGGVLWLFRVQERIPPRRLPLERVEEDIRAVILQRESKARIPEYLARIRKEASVEMLWRPVSRP